MLLVYPPCLLLTDLSSVVADLHKLGMCYDKKVGGGKTVVCRGRPVVSGVWRGAYITQQVFDERATNEACNAYLKRNTGNKKWDKCPDCTLVSMSGRDPETSCCLC